MLRRSQSISAYSCSAEMMIGTPRHCSSMLMLSLELSLLMKKKSSRRTHRVTQSQLVSLL